MLLHLDTRRLSGALHEEELKRLAPQALLAWLQQTEGNGEGKNFLGWRDLPVDYDKEEFARIQEAAERIRQDSDVLVVAGIGGSYLGARAVIEALRPYFKKVEGPEILFAGNNVSPSYLADLMDSLRGQRVSVNVISKSGSTTETAVAFRVLRAFMEESYGEAEAARRIFATTDKEKGALKTLAQSKGYASFVVPDAVGGRYSVLTAVGLLPIAAAGHDISALMRGAAAQREVTLKNGLSGDAAQYAMHRCLLLRRGYEIEVLANFEPALHYFAEWWKQLFGETEGKDGKSLFPAAVDLSTDLHSMGQYLQDGKRIILETFLSVEHSRRDFPIPVDHESKDGLAYLEGRPMSELQKNALQGTELAHADGGTPNMRVSIARLDEEHLGALIYFFEFACGLSGYLNGLNPFDQPGVEAYKNNMYALLGKPGYEELARKLHERL